MSFELRFAIMALAAFALANAAAAALVPWMSRARTRGQAAGLAAALRRLRLLPLWLSLGATGWASLSFLVFEPREQDETFGVVLMAMAGCSLVLIGAALMRGIWIAVRNHQIQRAWLAGAESVALEGVSIPTFAIPSAFPLVAIVGLFRPRLVIAKSVLAACTRDELRAILAHEGGHLARRDNATRLVFATAPDLLGWLPVARRLAAAWHEAAEDAADDCAGELGSTGRVALAEALIRVARLAPRGSAPIVLPASALYRGEGIERRVRRLLAPPVAMAEHARPRWRRAGTSLSVVLASLLTLHLIHEAVEAVVAFLP